MFEDAITEFPFVGTLPKREKSKLARLWDHFSKVRQVVAEKGMLVPQHLVADLLGVSRQRICTLVNEGRFDAVEIHGVRYLTESSVVAYAKAEKSKGGRPRKLDDGELLKSSLSAALDIVRKTS